MMRRRTTIMSLRPFTVRILTFLAMMIMYASLLAQEGPQLDESPISPGDREHWSFKPLTRPTFPVVIDQAWPRTGVDRFVLAMLEENQLKPAPEASPETMVRRLYLDLIGLPPTVEQTRSFLEQLATAPDQRDYHYARLVDQLLGSPQYGQHWAQYWLDLARFAETDGFEHDKLRPKAWQYRDWVIRALNDDMPYDQFIQWQIAGDLLAPGNSDASTATAFCLSGPDMPDINSQDERKHMLLDELTGTVGSVLLGLQIGCAQCHNHVYDPISQGDFYRLRACFAPAVWVTRDKPVTTLRENGTRTSPVQYVHLRGDWRHPGPIIEPGMPRIADPETTRLAETEPGGRRAALAQWLTSPQQPLTSRVIVNRIWQYHFGRGISATPSDFGVMGDEPTHPQLLDWLATELIAQQWQLKSLHRLIVTSSVYRQASHVDRDTTDYPGWRESLDRDPNNNWLARFPRRRLRAEAIRNAMLATSGSLVDEFGGPGVRPPLPAELLSTLLPGQWDVTERLADHRRHGIYLFARRNLNYPLFAALDRPSANSSCPARSASTTATQALSLFNSSFSLEAAERFAAAVETQTGPNDHDRQVRLAAQMAWSRPATDEEVKFMLQYLSELSASSGTISGSTNGVTTDGLTTLCLVLLNSSEFIYLE